MAFSLMPNIKTQHHQKNLQTINAGEGWRKVNPLALSVGMQIDTATIENLQRFL